VQEYRALGTVAPFASSTSITLTVTLSGGGGATLNSSDAAYPTISASTKYRFPDLCQKIASAVQTWLFDAMTADAAVTTKPSAAADIDVTLTFTPSTTPGGSLCTLAIGPDLGGAQISGNAATVSGVTLNASAAWVALGLTYDGGTATATINSGTATVSGLFQPRSIFVVDRTEDDSGDAEEETNLKIIRLADGTGSVYRSGRTVTTRDFRIVDLDEAGAGRALPIGRYSGFGATRDILTVPNPTTTGILSGISNLYMDTTLPTTGRYAEVGGFVSRIRSVSATQVRLCDLVPSSVTPPTASSINQISEMQALWVESVRLGYFVIYGINESSGALRWQSEEYMMGSPRWQGERRSVSDGLYSFTWSLTRRDASGLTLAS
jgi:hypothetical protein